MNHFAMPAPHEQLVETVTSSQNL